MFSEDYVSRMIRQATIFLAGIIGLKNSGKYQEALKSIDQALTLLIGMDADFVRSLDDESLYLLLTKNEELDLEKLWLVADVFKEEGDVHELQGHANEAIDCYTRSLNYYLAISNLLDKTYLREISTKIEQLLQKLDLSGFSEKNLWNLFGYFEMIGEFSKADRIIWKLAVLNDSAALVMDEIRSFYERLLEKSPQELTTGGINRLQIQDKLQKLR